MAACGSSTGRTDGALLVDRRVGLVSARGKGWSRALLFLGAAVSVAGNVRHAMLPPKPFEDSTAAAWRAHAATVDYTPVPEAVIWAALVVLASWMSLEAIVRIRWDTHRVWGWVIKILMAITVFAVAIYASYGHLSALLFYAGQDWLVVLVGPALPDGMMLLGTAGLLLAGIGERAGESAPRGPSMAARVAALRAEALAVKSAALGQSEDIPAGRDKDLTEPTPPADAPSDTWTDIGDKDMSAAPFRPEGRPTEIRTDLQDMARRIRAERDNTLGTALDGDIPADKPARKPRPVSWDKDRATALIKDTVMNDQDIALEVGVSSKTIQRLRRDIRESLGLS